MDREPYDPARGLINGANLVGGLIEQGRNTQNYVSGMFDTAARRRAGAAIANGDNQAAAQALGERGDIANADLLRGRASTQSSLQAIQVGNFDRAREEAASAGDIGLFDKAKTAEADEKKARVGWMGNAADTLLKLPAEKRHGAFQEFIAPTLKAMGMEDKDIALVDQQSLTDEGLVAFKTSIGALSKGELHQDPNTGDWLVIDPASGRTTVAHKAAPKKDWKEFKRSDGSSYWKDMNAVGGGEETDVNPNVGGSDGTPEVKGGTYDKIAAIAAQAGAKPEETTYLKRLAQVESNANPSAKNGSSTGVFQFHPDTFAGVGGTDINSVEDQTKAAIELARRDRAMLEKAGVPATDANVYIMHQQGAGGGRALLTAPPEVNAIEALTPVYGSAKIARKAIVNNGGTADMTAGEFVDYWRNRWAGGAKAARGAARSTSGIVEGDQAPLPDWQSDGQGNLVNRRTGDRKPDPTKGQSVLSPDSGLSPIGDPAQGLYKNKVGQKFQTNRAGTITRLGGPTDGQVEKAEGRLRALNETISMVDAVDAQLGRTRTLGPGGRYILNQEEFAKLDSLTKQLQIAYKNAAELGAITGPDVPFIEAVAPNPREFRSLVQRGEFRPRLESLAKVAGTKFRGEISSFKALGGDPDGLTQMFVSPRSKIRSGGKLAPTTVTLPSGAKATVEQIGD